jgi:hypothetical protein
LLVDEAERKWQGLESGGGHAQETSLSDRESVEHH